MVAVSQRRRHPRWRMLFAVVILSVLVRHCEQASIKRLTDSGSSPSSPTLPRSPPETRLQNLGSSSDLTWQAWLLLDSQAGAHSGMDSASFRRRITPKSVFIAPELPGLPPCSEGYRADTMGRCVKNVNIDTQAHNGFLLQRLNNRYGIRGGSSDQSHNSQKKSSGPFQLNIPLLSNSPIQYPKFDYVETRDSIRVPIVVPPRSEIHSDNRRPSSWATVHQTKNNGKLEADRTTVSPVTSGSSFSGKHDQDTPSKLDTVVPVAEFVDDANGTDFSEVVDYKIPIDLRALLNTSLRTVNASVSLQPNIPIVSSSDSQSSKFDHEETRDSIRVPIVVLPLGGTHSDDRKPLSWTTIRQTTSDSKVEEDQTTFSPGTSDDLSSGEHDEDAPSKSGTVVPVAEFVDDANGTNFSEVVDYKIPIDLRTLLNTSLRTVNTSEPNIPVPSSSDSQSSEFDHEETRDSIRSPIVVLPLGETHSDDKNPSWTTIDQTTSSDSKVEEYQTTFPPGTSDDLPSGEHDEDTPSKLDTVVPVAEFVDDANGTDFSEVVDYKIPIDLRAHLNTSLRSVNTSQPLQPDTPILSDSDSQSSEFDHEETRDTIKDPIVVLSPGEIHSGDRKPSSWTTIDQTTNSDSKVEEDQTTFPPETSDDLSPGEHDEDTPSKLDTVVPVAEFVDDPYGSNFAEVVNYKIPIVLRTLLNMSLRTANASEDLDAWQNGSQSNQLKV